MKITHEESNLEIDMAEVEVEIERTEEEEVLLEAKRLIQQDREND